MPDYILPIPVQDSHGDVYALDVLGFRGQGGTCAEPALVYTLNGAPVAKRDDNCFEVLQSGVLLWAVV